VPQQRFPPTRHRISPARTLAAAALTGVVAHGLHAGLLLAAGGVLTAQGHPGHSGRAPSLWIALTLATAASLAWVARRWRGRVTTVWVRR